MRKLLILTILIFSSCLFLHAQTNLNALCPSISVDGPTRIVAPGEIATFSARITHTDLSKDLKYTWSSSAGEIIKGQGTTTISVRQPNQPITVSLQVNGLAAGCPNLVSETESSDLPQQALKLGEISDLRSVSASSLLERVVQVIKDNPNAQLFVLSGHIGGKASADVSTKELELLRDLSDKGIDENQISVTGVFTEVEIFQFWLVPPGANRPQCRECEALEKAAKEPLCPTISVDSPAGDPGSDGLMTFTAKINGTVPKNVTYMWTVNDGEIVNGQGTKSIKIHQTSEESGVLVATLEVNGLPQECPNMVSETAPILDYPYPTFIAEYSVPVSKIDKAELDRAIDLRKQSPNDQIFIIEDFKEGTSDFDIRQKVKITTVFLIDERHLQPNSFEIVTNKSAKTSTRIYLLQPGAKKPVP